MNARGLALCALAVLTACARNASHRATPLATPAFAPVAYPHAAIGDRDLGSLAWREVGPAVMGGRLDAVAGIPGDATTVYLGHSSGGLYKSTNGGMTFASIFDAGTSSSIGALALAPSDPKTIYAGTGEGFPRNTAALGDGVFVSHDAGKTWKRDGLAATQHIARIAVDPRNPSVLLVAAMGPEYTAGGERGIYRSDDGGKRWTRVLYVNATTGGSDVLFDPMNPSIAFAGTFDYLRRPWTFRGGGPGSGVWKSTDGGRTWRRLTDPMLHDGLPGGTINRVGVALCATQPNVVYAIVPTRNGLLYRSDDGGTSWKLVNDKHDLVFRPFYFSQVRVNPNDPNDVWIVSGGLYRSKNGGKTFKSVDAGGDNHDLWIDPKNTNRIILGSDMGLDISLDNGVTWDYVDNVPMSQVYRVGYDRRVPYDIMGGMQDHEVWWGPNSLWNGGAGVTGGSWRNISDWGDGQYAMPDPRDADLIYEDTHFGDLTLRNLRTGEARYIGPQPIIPFGTGAGAYRYRFNWSAPLLVSHVHPGTVYFGGDVLFETHDGGTTWRTISPDLSQPCNRAWLGPSGGPITHDNTNAETFCTIYALAEGETTLWAGTDDGRLFVTSNGGASWRDAGKRLPVPRFSWIDSIETSNASDDVAYVTVDRHRFGDTSPYVFVTHDRGRTWTKIVRGLPVWAYVVRQDPRQPNLLFAGTERGVYVSFNDGRRWSPLRLSMPPVPVYDMKIQPDADDLIVGTHGRGFVILDDLAPLEGLARAVRSRVALFAPQTAWRYAARPSHDIGRSEFVSEDKPYGALISYYLKPAPKPRGKKAPKEKVDLEILANGRVIKHLKASTKPGVNRVVWDLTTDPPGGPHAKQDTRPYYVFYSLHIDGPEVLPGQYTVRLQARGQTLSVPLAVRMDPAVHVSTASLRAQFDAMERLAVLQERGERWIAAIDADRKKLGKREPALRKQLVAEEDRLRNGNGSENAGYQFAARPVDQLAYLRHIVATSFDAPTAAQYAAIARYRRELNNVGTSLRPLLARAARALPTALPSRTPVPRRSPR